MYSAFKIFNLEYVEKLSKNLKFEFTALVSQANRCSPIDEKGGLGSRAV